MMKHLIIFVFTSIYLYQLSAQNLLSNPGAEDGDPTLVGWTLVAQGDPCYTGANWRITGNQQGFPAARSGSQIFFTGCNLGDGEIYQDVDVSAHATSIDAGDADFTFVGYTQVYDQDPADGARIIVEYLNAAKTVVLASYNTGETQPLYTWQANSDTQTAPSGTRHVRVRLLSYEHTGPSVDGYFDDLSLTASFPLPVELIGLSVAPNNKNEVKINWSTASEINNEYFYIERSINGTNWESITRTKWGRQQQ